MKLWGMTVVLTALLAASADDQPGGLAEKVRKAAFVFKGTVSQTGLRMSRPSRTPRRLWSSGSTRYSSRPRFSPGTPGRTSR